MTPIRAAVALVRHKGHILMGHRHPSPTFVGWCLPGGKVEPDETPEHAALRELREETGITGRVIQSLGKYRSISLLLDPYMIEAFEVEALSLGAPITPSAREYREVRWVPSEDAWKLPLAGNTTRSLVAGTGLYWPLANRQPLFPDEPGQFGTPRRFDIHTGVDLYCPIGTPVLAMEDGEVISIEYFTGPNADSPWWNDTKAILVQGKHGIILYGEVTPQVSEGQKVERGEVLGHVAKVLKKDKGRPTVMLHLELMAHPEPGRDPVESNWWKPDEPKPEGLLDPTPMLIEAAGGCGPIYPEVKP